MWAALAVSAVLAAVPADAGPLQIKNDRFTYGIMGQDRQDNKVIPGDTLVVAFDIDGLQVKEDGKVKYSTAMELLDKDGKSQFKRKAHRTRIRQRARRLASALLEPREHRHRRRRRANTPSKFPSRIRPSRAASRSSWNASLK